jgi:hypothetical protein
MKLHDYIKICSFSSQKVQKKYISVFSATKLSHFQDFFQNIKVPKLARIKR